MGQRADRLADQLGAATDAVIATVERCASERWRAVCRAEGWGVNITAHHIAGGNRELLGYAQIMADGRRMPPTSRDDPVQDEANARRARELADCTKEDVLAFLHRSGAAAVAYLRSLTDEQLDRSQSVLGEEMTTEQFIQVVLIDHVEEHLGSIRAATGLS